MRGVLTSEESHVFACDLLVLLAGLTQPGDELGEDAEVGFLETHIRSQRRRLAVHGATLFFAGLLLGIPFAIGLYIWPDGYVALRFAAPAAFLGAMWIGPSFASDPCELSIFYNLRQERAPEYAHMSDMEYAVMNQQKVKQARKFGKIRAKRHGLYPLLCRVLIHQILCLVR